MSPRFKGRIGKFSAKKNPGGSAVKKGSACKEDSECSDGIFCTGVELCKPGSKDADSQGCVQGALPCKSKGRCLENEDRCAISCEVEADADGDGAIAQECGGDDCDDSDPMRYPKNLEICDADHHDEDCDPLTFGERDDDNDGYVDATCCNNGSNGLICGDDCNDGKEESSLPQTLSGAGKAWRLRCKFVSGVRQRASLVRNPFTGDGGSLS